MPYDHHQARQRDLQPRHPAGEQEVSGQAEAAHEPRRPSSLHAPLAPDNLLFLQRTAGNRAVGQLLSRAPRRIQRGKVNPSPLKTRLDSISAGKYEQIVKAAGDEKFDAVRTYLRDSLSKPDAEFELAVEQVEDVKYDVAQATPRVEFLTPYLPKSDRKYTIAHDMLQHFGADVAKAKESADYLIDNLAIGEDVYRLARKHLEAQKYDIKLADEQVQYFKPYLPEGKEKYAVAEEMLNRLGKDKIEQARAATDFVVGYLAEGLSVVALAKEKLASAHDDVAAAAAAMAELKPYNYDPELKAAGAAHAQDAATRERDSKIAEAQQTKQASETYIGADLREPVKPPPKRSQRDYTRDKKLYDAEIEKRRNKIAQTYQEAVANAETEAKANEAATLTQFTTFLADATRKVGAETAKAIAMHPQVSGDPAKAAAVLPLYEQRAAPDALPLAEWALGAANGPVLADLATYLDKALKEKVDEKDAKELAGLLANNPATGDTAAALIGEVAKSADRPTLLKFIVAHKDDLNGVKELLSRATTGVPVAKLIELCGVEGAKVADVSWAMRTMEQKSLTTPEDATELVKLVTRKQPILTKKTITELLELQPIPKQIGEDLTKLQSDPVKLKTLLSKVTKEDKVSGGQPKRVVNRPTMEKLAGQDPNLETQDLLERNVDPQLLIKATAPNALKPARLAGITKGVEGQAEATQLVEFATDRAAAIETLIGARKRDPEIVKRMKNQAITVAEAGEMARFEHLDSPGDKQLPGYGHVRLTHFAVRHTYRYFQFEEANIKDTQTMWPEGTSIEDIEQQVKQTADHTPKNPDSAEIGAKYFERDVGGFKIGFGLSNKGRPKSIDKFHPLGAGFSEAEMKKFKTAFKGS